MTSQKEKSRGVLIEWTVVQNQLFKVQTGTFATHGFVVCLIGKCYRKMLNRFKFYNALFNGIALLMMAAGMIAGPILEKSILLACLAAVGTVVKGWNDLKKYRFIVDMSRFAFTSYANALIESRTYVRGIPFEGLEGFCSRCKRWMIPSSISRHRYPNAVCKNTTVIFSTNQWVPNATWMDVIVP